MIEKNGRNVTQLGTSSEWRKLHRTARIKYETNHLPMFSKRHNFSAEIKTFSPTYSVTTNTISGSPKDYLLRIFGWSSLNSSGQRTIRLPLVLKPGGYIKHEFLN